MKPRHDERYESDTTPSRELVRRYREGLAGNGATANLAVLTYRGGEEEFAIAMEYSRSADPLDRATGAAILGQLGWSDQTFHEESIALLLPLLDDVDAEVVCEAAVALGHRKAETAIPALAKLARHPESTVRCSVVKGLLCQEHPLAVSTLIALATDPDRDVRSWAVFGLGSQIETDTPEIRAALRHALNDTDHEIRGEALVGLAERGDPGIIDDIIREWRHEFISMLSLEAAHLAADPRLFPHLKEMSEGLSLPRKTANLRIGFAAP